MSRRDTPQQRAIRSAIETSGRPLSVREIQELAEAESPTVSVATVYRVLKRLQEDGELTPVSIAGQPDRYELATVAAVHHHHFRCEVCDRVFDIEGCPGGLSKLLPPGFTLTGHDLSLWGRCPACT